MLKWAFCGFDHGATSYCTNLLRGAGINCGHEEVFSRCGVRENAEKLCYEADAGYATIAHVDHPFCDGAMIVHWLRHPVDQVNSWLRAGWHHGIEMWARKLLYPVELPTESLPYLTERLWHTNKLIEQCADVRLRAEDRLANLEPLGIEPRANNFDDPRYNPHEARQLNHRKGDVQARIAAGPSQITWADLPEKLQKQYIRYGYEPSDTAGLRHATDAVSGEADRLHPPAAGDLPGAMRHVGPSVVEEWK